MKENLLLKIQNFGQSVWMDYLSRHIIESGDLDRLVKEDGLRGITSNPTIFAEAIDSGNYYDNDIEALAQKGRSAEEIYQSLIISDIQRTADIFYPVYEKSEGRYGFASLEVNPHLAHDTNATILEARWYWKALNRPNVFIKVPATKEGLPAIRKLISEGININVTLLFGLPRYTEVTEAYISGIEDRISLGDSFERITSVASFFLSRIDVLADQRLEKIIKEGGLRGERAKNLRGEVAIASAKEAFQTYKSIFHGDRFKTLLKKGVRPQYVLWASTGTKNPDYSDIKYIEPLIGPETINTMPEKTIEAYKDHGKPAFRLEQDIDKARSIFRQLPDIGIDIDNITQQLENEGVEKFNKPYDSMMKILENKRMRAVKVA